MRYKNIFFAGFFFLVSAIVFFLFLFPQTITKKITQKVSGIMVASKPSFALTSIRKKNIFHPTTFPIQASHEENIQTSQTQTIQITIVVTPTPQPQSDKAVISVTIEGASSFVVSLEKGKNQCDVLSQALSDKKITNLTMKYDSSLDSYGVYQINGLGKENAVWWTYTVNGKSPTQGCNHIAANNGDSVKWQYVGSR